MSTFTRYADVVAVLTDPRYEVPAEPAADRPGTVRWLRAHVARFASGEVHARRRALVVDLLAGVDPADLRRAAGERVRAGVPAPDAPGVVLAGALTGDPGDAAHVAVLGAGYLPGGDPAPGADAAVAALLAGAAGAGLADVGALLAGPAGGGLADAAALLARPAGGGLADAAGAGPEPAGAAELVAARIGVLAQAQAATAALVRHAVRADTDPSVPVDRLLAETLRHDPPARRTFRVATVDAPGVPAGTRVRLDLAAALGDPAVFPDPGRFDPTRPPSRAADLAFGAGAHRCPGRTHALALAAGAVQATRPDGTAARSGSG